MQHKKMITLLNRCRHFILSVIFVVTVTSAIYAGAAATLQGKVVDPSGAVVAGAKVRLFSPISQRTVDTTTDSNGMFVIYNVPHNSYKITIEAQNFQIFTDTIDVHSDATVDLGELPLSIISSSDVVTVTGTPSQLIEVDNTSSHVDIDKSLIQRFPAATASRGTEQLLLSSPGFIADENGRTHFRGSHGQLSYHIDGVPITDQLQITFSNNLDPSSISSLEITTGGVPAEYGDRAAYVNVTTKSGLENQRNFFGTLSYGYSRFATNETGIQFGGSTSNKKFGYFATLAGSSSSRFLDPINFENLHNRGNTQRLFSRFDFQLTQNDKLTVNLQSGRSDYEVPNLLSQQLVGQDQSILNRDGAISARYGHIFNSQAFLDITSYLRTSQQQLFASPNDTPLQSSFGRRLTKYGVNANFSYDNGVHRFKTGVEVFGFPLREYLSFKITDPTYNAPFLNSNGDPDASDNPANANNPNPDYNPFLAAFDATRINPSTGLLGDAFFFEGKKTGKQFSFYLQDSYKFKNLAINGGLRVTNYRIFVKQTGVQPRLGLSYHIAQTGTVLRASYDRLFITPENEGLLITSSPQVIAATGSNGILIRPEIQNSYEIGFQQRIKSLLRIDGAYYTKDVRRPQDNDQFLNTGLLFPLSFGTAKLKGFDLKIDVPDHHGVTAYVSFGTNSAIFSPPATGGLLGEAPTDIFRIDHDQKVSIQSDIRYYNQKYGWWTAVSGRYDSGLVTDFDPAVLNNPDLAFGANFIRGTGDALAPFRIRPRAIFNYSAGIDLLKETHHSINLQFDLLNLTNKKGLYNFLSPFGGTHVIPPRTYSIKVKFNF